VLVLYAAYPPAGSELVVTPVNAFISRRLAAVLENGDPAGSDVLRVNDVDELQLVKDIPNSVLTSVRVLSLPE
jgi:hypothetical protein